MAAADAAAVDAILAPHGEEDVAHALIEALGEFLGCIP